MNSSGCPEGVNWFIHNIVRKLIATDNGLEGVYSSLIDYLKYLDIKLYILLNYMFSS